jgi:hypothetical protein
MEVIAIEESSANCLIPNLAVMVDLFIWRDFRPGLAVDLLDINAEGRELSQLEPLQGRRCHPCTTWEGSETTQSGLSLWVWRGDQIAMLLCQILGGLHNEHVGLSHQDCPEVGGRLHALVATQISRRHPS